MREPRNAVPAEPGFARREPHSAETIGGTYTLNGSSAFDTQTDDKEGAHGGTRGSPVISESRP